MISLIYLMAGQGQRMNLGFNKVFYEYEPNSYLFEIALDKFLKFDNILQILLVTNQENIEFIKERYKKNKRIQVIEGGNRRQDSVNSALKYVTQDLILIHDSARCFISYNDISNMLNEKNFDAIYAAKISTNTIRKQINEHFETLNREMIYNVETPQLFKKSALLECIKNIDYNKEYTDEISLFENQNYLVRPFLTKDYNQKLTDKNDLEYFFYLKSRGDRLMFKIGHSYDIHQLSPNRKLILGGIEIENELGLLGISDADCLLHAIGEALLGALALGDLGTYFDPKNSECQDLESKYILKHCYNLVRQKKYKISNIDCMIFAEEPKMKPYILQMRENVAQILNIELDQISIKATTFEKMDSIGEKKAIASEAVVLLESEKL